MMEGKQDGSSPDLVGGRACPARVGVGQAAKGRDMGVEAGEQSWRLGEPQGIVDCMDGSVDRVQEALVEEEVERASVDGEVETVAEMVRAAYRSSHLSEIEICGGSGSVSVSRNAEPPFYLCQPDCVIESRIVGCPGSASCRCTDA